MKTPDFPGVLKRGPQTLYQPGRSLALPEEFLQGDNLDNVVSVNGLVGLDDGERDGEKGGENDDEQRPNVGIETQDAGRRQE